MSVWSFIQISITIRIYYKLKRFLVWHNIGEEEMSASLNLIVLILEANHLFSTFFKKHTEKNLMKTCCFYLFIFPRLFNPPLNALCSAFSRWEQWVKQCLECRNKAIPEPSFCWTEQLSELRAGNKREEEAGVWHCSLAPHTPWPMGIAQILPWVIRRVYL